MTRLIALLGNPVAHSLSPRMQNAAMVEAGIDGRYIPLRCDPADVPGLLIGIARAGGAGNVTVPHKERAAEVIERPGQIVRLTGACNTFWLEDGVVCGENTDVEGMVRAIGSFETFGGGDSVSDRLRTSTVLLLGAGGAARAAVVALERAGARRIRIRNRTRTRARTLAADLAAAGLEAGLEVDEAELGEAVAPDVSLVVNATSLGLDPDDPPPVDPALLPAGCAVLDLVYRSGETAWVSQSRSAGHPALDGLEMLLQQGALSFEHWWGRPAPIQVMREALYDAAGRA